MEVGLSKSAATLISLLKLVSVVYGHVGWTPETCYMGPGNETS